mmetsp:Transcript_16853/g.50497  ORF Transcript_16853/g.50497 Transcript_16853/m.50497 type:complete len:288 (+) Transcript_16853:930-1793(+)|eukprot:67501-Chlamydomonas_euryale.AAC.5
MPTCEGAHTPDRVQSGITRDACAKRPSLALCSAEWRRVTGRRAGRRASCGRLRRPHEGQVPLAAAQRPVGMHDAEAVHERRPPAAEHVAKAELPAVAAAPHEQVPILSDRGRVLSARLHRRDARHAERRHEARARRAVAQAQLAPLVAARGTHLKAALLAHQHQAVSGSARQLHRADAHALLASERQVDARWLPPIGLVAEAEAPAVVRTKRKDATADRQHQRVVAAGRHGCDAVLWQQARWVEAGHLLWQQQYNGIVHRRQRHALKLAVAQLAARAVPPCVERAVR